MIGSWNERFSYTDPSLAAGRQQPPMGYLTVSIFGIEGHTGYRDFTVAAADIYRDLFGIAPEDFYIKFDDITAWPVGSRYIDRSMFR